MESTFYLLFSQQCEYEQIYHVLSDRHGRPQEKPVSDVNRLELEDMEPPTDLKPKRSQSHGDIRKVTHSTPSLTEICSFYNAMSYYVLCFKNIP